MHEGVVFPLAVHGSDAMNKRVAHAIGIVDHAPQQVKGFDLGCAPRLLAR